MSSLLTEELKAKAEVYLGDGICRERSKSLMKEMGLPIGLLPLHGIEECGYVKEIGFVWLKQKKSITRKFDKFGKLVSYAPEVTAVVKTNKIMKLTGVKARELLVWISVSDIYVDVAATGKVTFKTPAGFSRSFPSSLFTFKEVVAAKDDDVKEKYKEETREVNGAPVQIKEV